MPDDFCLSEKIREAGIFSETSDVIHIDDIKDFITLLKEKTLNPNNLSKEYIDIFELNKKIDKLVGEKLI